MKIKVELTDREFGGMVTADGFEYWGTAYEDERSRDQIAHHHQKRFESKADAEGWVWDQVDHRYRLGYWSEGR